MEHGYDWLTEQVDKLSDSNTEIDRYSLQAFLIIEMANQEAALKSRTRVLIMHLLKWKYQPKKQTKSWKITIREQRRKIEDILETSTNLKNKFTSIAHAVYKSAKEDAAYETNLSIKIFPEDLEFSRNQLLNIEFLP